MASSPSTSSTSLKAQFYVIRHNGSFVPLIAMDEIPTTVVIKDVPRVIEARETVGMISVGEYESRHTHHAIEFKDARSNFIRSIDDINNKAANNLTRSLLASKYATSRIAELQVGTHTPPRSFGIHELPPSSSNNTSTTLTPSPLAHTTSLQITPNVEAHALSPLPGWHESANLPRANGIKTYCSYWLRHGECDYAQQGCLYKHEMPTKLEALKECGLRDLPRWYRELYGVGSLLAVPGSDASKSRDEPRKGIHGNNWRDTSSVSSKITKATTRSATVSMKPGITTVRESSLNYSNTRQNVPVGPTARTEQEVLMRTIKQLDDDRKKDIKFKQELAARGAASKSVNRPTSSSSQIPSNGELSSSAESTGTKPGLNTPTYSNSSDADDERNVTVIGRGISNSIDQSVTRLQETKAREQAVNNVTKSLEAAQAKQNSPTPKTKTKSRASRTPSTTKKRLIRKGSQSSISTTGAVDGDAGSLDGNPALYRNRKESVVKQPLGDLLEDFDLIEPKKSKEVDVGTGGLKVGTKGYVPYDHDD